MPNARETIATELANARALLLDNYTDFEDNVETLDRIIAETDVSIEDELREIGAEELASEAVFSQDVGYAQGLAFALRAIDGK